MALTCQSTRCPLITGARRFFLVALVVLFAAPQVPIVTAQFGVDDYREALAKCTLFYEAQRSGPLPASNRVPWRGSSGLLDGQLAGVDLTGGYYDAGDNVKFGFPMAFSVTLLSWSVIEYGGAMGAELGNALAAVRWGSDYVLKTFKAPSLQYAQVGDGNTDHSCWERPENMDTPRTVYQIDQDNPGTDLAAESAAALAAASIAFRSSDGSYADTLLSTARQLFTFADTYRGAYSDSIPQVRSFYNSFSGYLDELLWAAAWLHRASGDAVYLNYIVDNQVALNAAGSATEFSWDSKTAGADVLLARQALSCGQDNELFQHIKRAADQFVCYYVNGAVQTTPDGLAFIRQFSPSQYSNNAAFLAIVYSDYLAEAGASLTCGSTTYSPAQIVAWARTQIDYVLGDNNARRSYMVGFGSNFPTRVHHRGATIPSPPPFYSCGEGFQFLPTINPDPHVITGAIVGGPDANGNFANDRNRFEQSEPTTYINAGFMGAVARLVRGTPGVEPGCTAMGGPSQPTPTPTTPAPTTPAPTTPVPTTPTPTALSPATPSPTTPSPTTPSPTTPSPTTPAPTTPAPTTPAPTTPPPTTPSPTTPSPTTPSPTTPSPNTPEPTTPSPTTPAPTTPAPTTSSPTTPSPTTPAPTPAPTTPTPTNLSPTATPTPSPTGASPSPSPTACPGPAIFPAGGTCDASSGEPNQCFNADGTSYVCCAASCPAIPGVRPFCAGSSPEDCFSAPPTSTPSVTPAFPTVTPALPTGTPAPPTGTAAPPTGTPAPPTETPAPPTATSPAPTASSGPGCPMVLPAGGVCDASSPLPNQCFNDDGTSSICCPGSCSATPGSVPSCAGSPPGGCT